MLSITHAFGQHPRPVFQQAPPTNKPINAIKPAPVQFGVGKEALGLLGALAKRGLRFRYFREAGQFWKQYQAAKEAGLEAQLKLLEEAKNSRHKTLRLFSYHEILRLSVAESLKDQWLTDLLSDKRNAGCQKEFIELLRDYEIIQASKSAK